jgi:outer membrane protein OmpA-like peptidoglycan-associated protein
MKSMLFSLSFGLLLAGCGAANKNKQGASPKGSLLPESEKLASTDGPAPAGYRPVFMNGVELFSAGAKYRPSLEVTRIAQQGQEVSLYVHLADTSGHYLAQAAGPDGQRLWCQLEETQGTSTQRVKDFRLEETGPMPTAYALVMDHSASMGEQGARAAQAAAAQFIQNKNPDDAVCLIKYDNNVKQESPLAKDQAELLVSLRQNGLEGYGYTTAYYDAIYEGIQVLKEATGYARRVVLVYTNGVDNSSSHTAQQVLAEAQTAQIMICSIDLGTDVQPGALASLSAATAGQYRHIYLRDEFAPAFRDIYARLNAGYRITYTPATYGPHTVRLKLCLPQAELAASATYDNSPKAGETLRLNVFFALGSSQLAAESQEALNNVVELLNSHPDVRIALYGHTDNTGNSQQNQQLSQQRADAVKQALVQKGIKAERIETRGYGAERPIAPNTTPEGRAQNRRTEFVILE